MWVAMLTWAVGPGCTGPEPSSVTVEERRLIELMEMRRAGDATGIERLFHPTAVYDDFTSGVTYRDLPEIADFMEAFHTADGAVFLEVISYHTGNGMAVAEWVLEGNREGPSGASGDSLVVRRFRVDGLTLIEVQGGLIVRAADYGDPIPLILAEGGAVVFPEGDTLRAEAESATGPPPRR